ncbi:DUF58 domain-containing protein [Pedobacter sp. HMF7647]|uniref:DUF58 domain-containing protein n=2 Tax=Hufsiella arboris TaxID=2695275 RepID=A0A7K1Y8B6_9SPHI|nr:DUF58 domain-containing protein [Hufsiella arboris]
MSIKDLQLKAKTTVNGFLNGINKSTVKGPGMEFSQYRSYQPGDDLRQLDWKMFARSDRYYIRESEVETNISVRLLVDASASMNHEDSGYKKIDYAKYLAASLAYLANLQGDALGLYIFQEDKLFSLPSRQDFQHLSRLLHQLETVSPEGKFTKPLGYRDIYAGSQKRELLIFITDLYQEDNELYQLIDALNSLKHEVIVFHLLGRNELELDYKNYSAVQDLETGEILPFSSQSAKKYRENLEAYLASVKTYLLDRRVYYRLLITDQPIDQALRDFLNQRSKS